MKAFHVGIVLGNFPLLVSLGPPPAFQSSTGLTQSSLLFGKPFQRKGKKNPHSKFARAHILCALLVIHQQDSKLARVSDMHFLVKKK